MSITRGQCITRSRGQSITRSRGQGRGRQVYVYHFSVRAAVTAVSTSSEYQLLVRMFHLFFNQNVSLNK
ncbi:hypothetical protein EB796_013016 [Bugula neritina]|uniref:Uncharacterized protein n=1 Tax=Bugula neritina TaxID=10212 RepID=A0A7J7JT35_BUGNE|nr:hypothetical protein EB796_013016 [Bugula neritina]